MALDLRRYPDGLHRQRWRSTWLHGLAGALGGALLCMGALLAVPTAQDWQQRLAALQAQEQAHAERQRLQQHKQFESRRIQQHERLWTQWEDALLRLDRLWAVLQAVPAVELKGLQLDGSRAVLQVGVPDEAVLDRLLTALAQDRVSDWQVQQQTAPVQPGPASGQASAAPGWGFVLQAPWPLMPASGPASTSPPEQGATVRRAGP